MNVEKLMKMAGAVRTGGKGSVRRFVYACFYICLYLVLKLGICVYSRYVIYMTFVYMFRKKKAVHKTATTDDKRLQSTLKRIGVNSIPSIEEVNIFKDDSVIHFLNPKGIDSYSF